MKKVIDKILYRLQKTKLFWKVPFLGSWLVRQKGYAVQFGRSMAFSDSGYSSSGNVYIYEDVILFTKEFASEVYEKWQDHWQSKESKGEGYIHDDDLILWEYDNGYIKELEVFKN